MFGRSHSPARPGKSLPSKLVDFVRSAAEGASRSRAGPGIMQVETPSGKLDRRPRPGRFHARLTGGYPGYSFVEVYGVPTPALWEVLPGGRRGPDPVRNSAAAYDLNLTPGLDGQVVELTPVAGGAWYYFEWKSKPSGSHPTACPLTVHFQDCNGSAIAGATITVYSATGGILASGTTDSSGNYTLPDVYSAGLGEYFILSYDGASSGIIPFDVDTAYNCTHDYCLVYEHCKLTVNMTDPDSVAWLVGGQPPTSTTPGNPTVFQWKAIRPCWFDTLVPYFPINAEVYAGPPYPPYDDPALDGYLSNCQAVTLNCDDDTTINIDQYNFATDYWGHSGVCDLGCEAYGEGPNHRGVFPKVLYITFYDGFGISFGSLSGVPITITWNGSYYDSGCLSNPIYDSFGSPPALCADLSTVTLGGTGGDWAVQFTSWPGIACSGPVSPCGFYFNTVPVCDLTAPVDYSFAGGGDLAAFTITQ